LNLTPTTWDKSFRASHPLAKDISYLKDQYFESTTALATRDSTPETPLKVCYTAMHGVGLEPVLNIISKFNLPPLHIVEDQANPDPEFPTVPFPNPEEKGALDLAIEYAKEHDCQLIFANDPDADRFAVAELCDNDSYKSFTGNQIGMILASFMIKKALSKDSKGKYGVLTTVVSSHMLQSMAEQENVKFKDTLTGFKWLGNTALEMESKGTSVIFAFEEAIGYMCGETVKDKDGVSALALFYDEAISIYNSGATISKYLDQLYAKYGYWVSHNDYYICNDKKKIKEMFDRIRYSSSNELNYPSQLAGKKVTFVRDLTVGYDSSTSDHKPVLAVSASSQMITFRLEGDILLTLRTSGTEPKIKYYSEYRGEDLKSAQLTLDKLVKIILKELLPTLTQ